MRLSLKKVRYEKQGPIAYVTIDNVEHEKALEEQVDHDLWTVWHDFRDDPKLYVAILTGAGSKSFCAGSDLRDYVKRIAQRSPEWPGTQRSDGRRHHGTKETAHSREHPIRSAPHNGPIYSL